MEGIYAADWPDDVWELLFTPRTIARGRDDARVRGVLVERLGLVGLTCLVPLMIVDEASVACVVTHEFEGCRAATGSVVRVFHGEKGDTGQFGLLDVEPMIFVESIADELAARPSGITRVLDEIGPAFEASHLAKGKRPRDYVVRPIRIACQNVILALGAISQESSFDGLSVVAWQTCEVPHVATHEANRALAALTLCDAFQNGGTMEIRFDRDAVVRVNKKSHRYDGHPEGRVPASLRRFGRTVGVELGKEDPQAITPVEARELFWAITPMPVGLRRRAEEAVERLGVLPERLCFTLLAQVWREIELDFLLGTSHRAPSILNGGAPWTHRLARQAESEACRSAKMSGMLYRRLNGTDSASADGEVRVVEDRSQGVEWQVEDDAGAIRYTNLPEGYLPWSHGHVSASTLLVFPRAAVSNNLGRTLQAAVGVEPTAILIPRDAEQPVVPDGVVVMRCPDRLADIDQVIESTLLTSRISRG